MPRPKRTAGQPPTRAAERMRRYRARRRAAGLTLQRRWVPAARAKRDDVPVPYSDHRILEARSLALHCLAARKMQSDPRLLEVARSIVERWLRDRAGSPPPSVLEWRAILARPWPAIAALITEMSEEASRLRQSSPLAAVLTPAERRRVYEAFRA